jgi:hypothetical protein
MKEALKRALPAPLVGWIARRRARRRYLRAVSYEMLERESLLDRAEEGAAARLESFEERTVRDVLERTDVLLEELARRIDAQEARHARRIDELEREISELRRDGSDRAGPRLVSGD